MRRRGSGAGVLLGYFEKREEAAEALGKLRKRGFRRVASLSKSSHRPSGLGVERKVLKEYARSLLSGETALLIQAPVDSLGAAVEALRESGDIHPAVFVFHAEARPAPSALREPGVPLSPLQVREQAERLAAEHRLDPRPQRGHKLLSRLDSAYRLVRDTCVELSQAGRLELGTTATAEWILDNEYVIGSNARDVAANLPPKFYRRLPNLAGGRSPGLPRIYDLACELIAGTELRLDRENILAFIDAYQGAAALTIAELWAIPQMLRIALIERVGELALRASAELRERERADFWSNRLIRGSRRGPDQLFSILTELAVEFPEPSPYFAAQLVGHLYDEESVLVLVQGWLKRLFRQSLSELSLREQNRQAKDQISVGNAFTSLRQLALLDWREIFESLSRVERMLRGEACGTYPAMDFDTRDRYRRSVEGLSRASGRAEEAVAEVALALAREATKSPPGLDERRSHVGSYLIGELRPELVKLLGCAESRRYRLLRWVYRHSSFLFFSGFGFLGLASIFLVALPDMGALPLGLFLLLALLLALPISQLVLELLNYLATRSLPPRVLPKMDFEDSGVPDQFRTLVVVPVLLGGLESIRTEVEKLEVRFLANRGDNILFSLFTDYQDSGEAHREDDGALLGAAKEGIESLNARYGEGRFLLFHRERSWCETERKFIGWERKRGKLEELNGLLSGRRPAGAPNLVYAGSAAALAGPGGAGVRFVITLDSDTQLPLGTARRLIETLAHPLNRPRFDEAGRSLAGGYAIIQPRVSPSLPSTSASLFSRLFADAVGIDPYTRAISDVHQDLTGEGSYYGKGIYDLRAFDRVLGGRFPEERLLSHDLIEGAYVRVGLASDIELYDEFPRSYGAYADRQHRWIRGDWQIATWVSPRVPRREGGTEPNPLSAYDRWKLFDNLRRSLGSVADLALLLGSWAVSPRVFWIASVVVFVQLFFRPLVQPFTMLTSRRGIKGFSPSLVAHDLLRAVADASLLPHQALLASDAILRTLYRRFLSRRHLLQWTSAQVLGAAGPRKPPLLALTNALVSAASLAAALALALLKPSSLANAGPWLVAWFLSPLLSWLLNRPPRMSERRERLAPADARFLREVSRRTWRYFDDFVNAESSWLPPDNYQASPRDELALRTSPTNIGLWMLSALAARDFGYLTIDQLVMRLRASFASIGGLARFEGHLLNWYDLRTCAPLEPRFVSTVDSGNLLASLWTLEQGLGESFAAPLLDEKAFSGLRDAARILGRALGRGRVSGERYGALARLTRDWESPPDRFVDLLGLLREGGAGVGSLGGAARHPGDQGSEEGYWAGQLEKQLSAWLSIADRYLSWMEILAEQSEETVVALREAEPDEARAAVRLALSRAPSLIDLAKGRVAIIAMLQETGDSKPGLGGPMRAWLDRLLEAFSKSRWLAGEVLGLGEALVEDCRALSDGMDMGFLYDPERRLFSVGYDVSEGRRESSYYDLLASESRLGGFIAIARGEVPFEHWFALSRPYAALGRRRVLLSWTGTMFEYLMPLLFQDSLPRTLLGDAARGALSTQMEYGRRHRLPWGISESAFADMDFNKIYQYRAFGVPELRLKRESEEKIVVAPYASFLALELAPRESMRNLRRLAALRMLDGLGYYEAIDFSRQPGRQGERGVVVQSFMAHHQGMSFLALANALLGGSIRRSFYADARVRSAEPLLHERIPKLPPSHYVSAHDRPRSPRSVDAPATSGFDTAQTRTPKTQLLSNGRYSLMVTNSGGGYSQWGGVDITRWSSDPTRDSRGTFFYIHESDSGEVWTPSYQPVGGKEGSYSVAFALDRAVFRRLHNGIQSRMEIVLSPEDDVEIRRVTLTNRSLRSRRLECSSYIELSMAPRAADRQHPAFNKLFIQTEALPRQQALLAFRRQGGGEAPELYVAHRLTSETGAEGKLRFETDRGRFIGRGHTLADPLGAVEEPGGGEGFVLDPVLSLRSTLVLAPGQRATVSLVIAAGETREQALRLMGKYADPHAIDRALDFAWAAAQLELRVLRIQNDDARRFQQLASQLLYPSRLLRSHEEKIEENVRGQAGLWQYGISGDLPIALVTISELGDIGLVGQMLQAHGYWRMHGLKADLLILAEESSGYERPLYERLEALIQAHSTSTGRDKPGGVFLRSADQIPAVDLTLLHAAASIVLVSARGVLARQVGIPEELPNWLERPAWKSAAKETPLPLPFLELPYFNGLGGFTPDGREYAIYLGAGANTPAPWVNVIANPAFGSLVSEVGSGFTWSGNSQRNRLTSWSNDPVTDPCSEAIYLRDEETGLTWTPTAAPIREESAYRARHGAGYSAFEHNSNGIAAELTVFVPMDEGGGRPLKLQRLSLKNRSPRPRTLSLTYYVEWVLGEQAETSRMQVVTGWDEEMQAVTARNRFNPDCGERIAFAALSLDADSYSGDRGSFLGRNGSLEAPAAMERAALFGRTGAGYDPCAALRVLVRLAPGESAEITCMLGQTESLETARALVLSFKEDRAVEAALAATKAWWDELLGAVEVHTPELAADFLIDRWLLYQTLSCRIWGRSAFYQSGGAFGFRDQLQDVMALLYAAPGLARDHLLLAASRQFREGDVQHWWHPPGGAGIRSRISDDLLWLPFVLAQYVRITGDAEILKAEVPFLEGPALRDDQSEAFFTPTATAERADIFEHCRRAVERGLTEGPHGLPLMGRGDWNDGMNLVGAGGRGESVWLAWFLVEVLRGMSELSLALGRSDSSAEYLAKREALIARIEAAAWDGDWYVRAIDDEGARLGSASDAEGRIDSLPQSWATLSGGGTARSRQALDSAWNELVREEEGLVLLFTPPFDKTKPSPGYIQAYPPGVRENGGQYTHAAIWLAMAMARSGDGGRAGRLLQMLNPIEQARESQAARRYSVEPYVMTADVYDLPGHVGRGGWSWYTGSSAWMYRTWVEEVLGLKLRGERLSLDPVIPGWWKGFRMKFRHGEALYEIEVENPDNRERGIAWLELDGVRLQDAVLALERDRGTHRVLARMG
ncbi:MAG TPA: glucoamylase family protein [Rectinemataceae bacterium]|nr:glucoamylase family protein [Rectinemataceae bacterium]